MNNLAAVLCDQGKYVEAEVLYRHGLQGREEVLGPTHPQTPSAVNNFVAVRSDNGIYDEAETLYRRGLQGTEGMFGPTHSNTLS